MGLISGTKLGPYEIVAPLGAGGMGEVYRARDLRLERTVAVKVLNSSLVASDELRARFNREARIISQLQHPHICVLHDVGREGSLDFLVMEFLEGESLAQRLAKGPLPEKELLKISIELADALEKAHRAGVVHRDLKPSNVMLTKTGAKLLDFGLAKPFTNGGNGTAASASVSIFSTAKTLTSPAPSVSPLSSAGSVIGTVQYMSPEQIQGIEADVRSDIFAFGVMLFEMATGRHAFDGKTRASIVGQILAVDPPSIKTLQPEAPSGLARVIQICLHKDPDERFQCAHDLKLELQRIATEPEVSEHAVGGPASRFVAMSWILIGALLVAVLGVGYAYMQKAGEPRRSIRAEILPPEKSQFAFMTTDSGPPAISPDGKQIAFVGRRTDANVDVLWIQTLDSQSAHPMNGTEGATYPFWSYDSRFIGFFANGTLKKVEATGGPPQVICDARAGRGGTWNADDVILFTPSTSDPIYKVPAGGGTPVAVTRLDQKGGQSSQRWPVFLPDGKHFLFWTEGPNGAEDGGIYVSSLSSTDSKLLLRTSSSGDFANGQLLFVRDNTLMAQKLNTSSFTLEGNPVPIAQPAAVNVNVFRSLFAVSREGTLIYLPGTSASGTRLMWYTADGKSVGEVQNTPGFNYSPRLSPDGNRLAVAVRTGGTQDIWMLDLRRETRTRLTFGNGKAGWPVFSPDGNWIYYGVIRAGFYHLYRRAADGTGSEETVMAPEQTDVVATSITSDGKYLAYFQRDARGQTEWDVYVLPLFGDDRKPIPQSATSFREVTPSFSPDGKWLAYVSTETGRMEVYVKSFPGDVAKYQASTNGGTNPTWSRDGKRLFFKSGDTIASVDVERKGAALELGTPREILKAAMVPAPEGPFDVSADGKRILVNQAESNGSLPPLTIVTNWDAALKR